MIDCEAVDECAKAHVDWLLEIMRPLLITEFVHGYKHGYEEKGKDNEKMDERRV